MKVHALLGFLLGCAVVIAHPLTENDEQNAVLTALRLRLNPLKRMYVYNDDEEMVEVNTDDDDDETEEETAKDLHNRVFFYLHTRNHPTDPQQLFLNDETALSNSDFDPAKPTKFITHGWMNSRKSSACTLIRDAYIEHGDYNVIVIDWSKITFRPYLWASRRVRMTAEYVGALINFLEKHGLDPAQVTVVGHSLGAHVVGIAARLAKGNVNYAVGLDPALPAFGTAGPGSRIASGDAEYVEIIHTNAGLLGYLNAIGDIDFYPNGGSTQIGCLVDVGGVCSHARSYRYFAESINTDVGFQAKHCRTFIQLKLGLCSSSTMSTMGGYKRQLHESGIFYLKTNKRSPFAKGH